MRNWIWYALLALAGCTAASAGIYDQLRSADIARAGGVVEADTSTAGWSWVIDEDSFASDLATKVPTQQSVKAYVDTHVLKAATSVSGWGWVIDEDSFASNLATKVPTQQSVKAYVDAAGGGGVPPDFDTYANCAASTPDGVGDWCQSTDSLYRLESTDGLTWDRTMYPGIGFPVTVPPSADWTAFNSGSVAASGGTRVSTVAASTSATLRGEYRTQPSLPFYVDACFDVPMPGTYGGASVGLGGTDGTGVAMFWDTDWNGTLGRPGGAISRWSAHTTFVASDYDLSYSPGHIVCKRYVDDDIPAERSFYTIDPADGTVTQIGAGLGRTVTITATSIGWWASTNDADAARRVRLVHWSTGTP